jgi:hypothetical protein
VACSELQIDDDADSSGEFVSQADPAHPEPEVDTDVYVPPAPVAAPRGIRSLQPTANAQAAGAGGRPSSAPSVAAKAADAPVPGFKDARPLTTLAGARAKPRLDYSDDALQAAAAAASVDDGGACEVESGSIVSLLWHESDTRVRSIVGNARIERVTPVSNSVTCTPFLICPSFPCTASCASVQPQVALTSYRSSSTNLSCRSLLSPACWRAPPEKSLSAASAAPSPLAHSSRKNST